MQQAKEPRSLAGEYLSQAVDALHASGDPHLLYPGWARAGKPLETAAQGLAYIAARQNHLRQLRAGCLFSAVAAEAYVNEFLAATLPEARLSEIDRWPTVDKYVKGTHEALGTQLFRRAGPPVSGLKELFALRNKLAHPKPGYGVPSSPVIAAREPYTDVSPDRLSMFIVSVAAGAQIMVSRASGGELDFPAHPLWHGRKAVTDYGIRIGFDFPTRTAPSPPTLWAQIMEAVAPRAPTSDS